MRASGGWIVALALLFALVAAFVGVGVGPSGVGLPEVSEVLDLRLSRTALGLLVGAALALSGVILQALLRNDLAEPYLVGVGPGAFLGVTFAALIVSGLPSPVVRAGFALAGALLVSLFVFSFLQRAGRAAGPTLLLAGVAIGAFASAIATAILYVSVADWSQVVYWLLGHLGARDPVDLLLLGVTLLTVSVLAFVRARDLDAVALGEEGAWLVGVDVRRLLLGLGLAACLLAAVAVSVAGLIGFVGLLVPHVARGLVGPGHRRLIPVSLALGAGLLVLADALARTAMPPLELPVGVVTAAIGGPFLAWVLLKPR